MTSRKTNLTLRDKKQTKKQRSRSYGRRLFLEPLEDRRMLAVTADFDGGLLTVSLSEANDHAFISYDDGNIRVGTSDGGDDVYDDLDNITAILVEDTGANADQAVTFSGTNTITATGGGNLDSVTVTGIETANVNQLISVTTISGDADEANVAEPGRIQHGVDLAAASATVSVAAGTYNENVNVPPSTDGLSLLGANAGISANPNHMMARGAESIVVGQFSVGVPQGANEITVDGFTVQSAAVTGFIMRGGLDLRILNNIIEGQATFPTSGTSAGITIADTSAPPEPMNVHLANNFIGGYRHGINVDGSAGAYDASGVPSIISGNYITNNERGISSQGSIHGGTIIHEISGNTIVENDRGIRLAAGGFTISENTIKDNNLFGIHAGQSTVLLTGLTIESNTITNSGTGIGLILESSVGVNSVLLKDLEISGFLLGGGSISNVATVNWETTDDDDGVFVDGATSEFSASGDKVVQAIGFSGVTTLNVSALDGEDTVTVSPHPTTEINLDGGPPSVPLDPGEEGDTLIYVSDGVNAFNFGPATITTDNHADINYTDFENTAVSGDFLIDGTGEDDLLIITATSSNSGTFQLIVDQGGLNEVIGPIVEFENVNSVTFNGLAGDDTLRIVHDFAGVFAPSGGVFFNGGAGGDSLEILDGEATTVEHVFTNASDGFIHYNGSPTPNITYTGLAPIDDTIVAVDRIFTFTGAEETITLSNDTITAGNSHIVSTLGESVSFANPTGSLTIDTTVTAGADAINVQGLDGAFDADLTVDAKATDTVTFESNPTDIGDGDLDVTAGTIVLSANVSTTGNAALNATTAEISGSGTLAASGLTANAVSGMDLNTTVATITAGVSAAGAISITESYDVTLTSVTTEDGPITVSAGGAIAVDEVSAPNNTVKLEADGAITDDNDDDLNITASSLDATAGGGIELDTDVDFITAETTAAGAILLREANGVTLTSVISANGPITISAGGTVNAVLVESKTDDDANDITISTTAGDIVVTTITAGAGVAADVSLTASAGKIYEALLMVQTVTGDVLTLSAATGIELTTVANSITATSTTGDIIIDELDAVTLTSVVADGGTIEVDAGGTMTVNTVSAGGSGSDVRLTTAAGNIELGSVAADDTVLLQADGAIGGAAASVIASQLAMTAGAAIGASDAIETTVSTLAATAGSGTGHDVQVTNIGNLTIGSVTAFNTTVTGITGGGNAIITALSPLTVAQKVTMVGDVELTAEVSTTPGNDRLTVLSTVTVMSTGGSVTLKAGDDLTLEDSSTVQAADEIDLIGGAGNAGATISLLGTLDADGTSGNITVTGGDGDDRIIVNPGVGHSADGMTLDGGEGDDTYIVWLGRLNGGADAVSIEDSGSTGGDTAIIHGTDADETFTVHNNVPNGTDPQTGGFVQLDSPSETVNYTQTLNFLTVNGGDGADLFEVQPSQTAEITIDGGSPSFGLGPGDVPGPDPNNPNPGDILDFDPMGNFFTIVVNEIHTAGGDPDAFKPVRFLDIESVPLEPIGVDTFRFDMNSTAVSQTQTDYTPVLPSDLYDSGTGYGWVTTGAGGIERPAVGSTFSDLIRDAHWGSDPRTFRVDVQDTGWYLVSVKMGDLSAARDQMRVRNVDTGQILLDNVDTVVGQVRELNFAVKAWPDNGAGRIQLEFSNQGGNPYWMVNAIEVRPGEILNMGIAPQVAVADGATETIYTGVLASSDALVTVTTTLGTIITPDADPHVDGLQVQADGDGNFEFTIRHPSGGGLAVLTFSEVTGAKTGIATIDYSLPTIRRFDFNQGVSPTQAPINAFPIDPGVQESGGYIGVLAGDTYTADRGYGWEQAVGSVDRGPISGARPDLRRDAHWGTGGSGQRVFRTDLANGTYFVNITLGDTVARDQVQIRNADTGVVLDVVDTAAGEYRHVDLQATVSNNRLRLEFDTLGGNPYWMVNGMEIRLAAGVLDQIAFIGTHGALAADGVTVDTITGTAPTALEGTLLTITSTMGTILTDATTQYAGTQVLVAAGGAFAFDLLRPTVGGVPQLRAVAVDGSAEGSIQDATFLGYAGLPVWRFDMNHPGSPTQEPVASPSEPTGYVAVLPDTTYSDTLGYGWITAPGGSVNRGTLSGTDYSDLLQDSHWGTGARTFQIDLPDGNYEVTVTMGDTVARDFMDVIVVKGTGTGVTGISTAAGQYVHRTFAVSPDDGQIQLQFTTTGGNPYWMVNAIEVRPVVASFTLETGLGGDQPADGTTIDTFSQTGLPDGLYTVTTTAGTIVNADADSRYAGIQVLVAGGALDIQLQRPSGAGVVTVSAEHVAGLANASGSQTYIGQTALRFDMNHGVSPTQTDYTAVLPSTLYEPSLGYGWLTAPGGVNRGTLSGTTQSALLQDSHWGTGGAGARTFQIDLPDGDYEVTVTMGDTSARDFMDVIVVKGTGTGVTGISTAAGQYVHRTFGVSPDGGEIQLQFTTTGGNPHWMVNAIEVRPVVTPVGFTTAPTSQTADGVSEEDFTVTGLTAGDIYTVSTTLGSIVTGDADTRYTGTQVIVDAGGELSFTVRSSWAGGTAQVQAEQVNGASRFETTVDHVLADVRRFDFDGSANDTATDFIGVRGNQLYSPTVGYGWDAAAGEVQRGVTGYSKTTVPLFRDGHWGTLGSSGSRTFSVQVNPNIDYGVRVYFGDRNAARDNIEVRADGNLVTFDPPESVSVINTAANEFFVGTFTVNADASGILEINILNTGGNAFWIMNGLEVWEDGSDPGPAPLMIEGGALIESGVAEVLTADQLAPIVDQAIVRWSATGLGAQHVALLDSVQFTITDLDAQGYLGLASPGHIQIDDNGAGYGWFIDPAPWDDSDFVWDAGRLVAGANSPAAGRVDLLTVVMHELGHTLGLPDLEVDEHPDDLMTEVLGVGTRRLPTDWHASLVQGEQVLAEAQAQALAAEAAADSIPADLFFHDLGTTGAARSPEPATPARVVPATASPRLASQNGLIQADHLRTDAAAVPAWVPRSRTNDDAALHDEVFSQLLEDPFGEE